MKKQITIENVAKLVANENEVLALDLSLAAMVAIYNSIVTDNQVKKFTDKKTAAKRLFAVLPEAPASEKPAANRPGSVKTILRELYAVKGMALTLDQLLDKCSCQKKVLMDDIARLKNPTYAGKAGILTIVRFMKDGTGYYINENDLAIVEELFSKKEEAPAEVKAEEPAEQVVEDGTEGTNSMVEAA